MSDFRRGSHPTVDRWRVMAMVGVPLLWTGFLLEAFIAPGTGSAQQMLAPTRVQAAETGPGVVTLTWSPVPGAREYHIGRSVWPNGLQRAGVTRDTIFLDSTVSAGKRHVYAVNAVGSSQRARSNEVIPGVSGVLLADAQSRAGRIAARSGSQPATPAAAGFTPPPELLTPQPDTISAARCTAEANRKRGVDQRLPRRVGRDEVAPPEDASPLSELNAVQRAYVDGKCRSPNSPGHPALWYPVAERSGYTHEELVRAWRELGIVALAYKHLLQREPTREEIQRQVASLQRGRNWRELWRELAHSAERDQRFGYWAPAPISTRTLARSVFGLNFDPKPEMCYGGLGPGCGGTIPDSRVEPRWFGRFSLPDGTEFGYVSLGVAVGSIVHDNACLVDQTGLNCSGLGAGDLVKSADWPGALEWNKASWNVLDGRVWRDVFGPYPIGQGAASSFYDDLRMQPSRAAYMAPTVSMATIPVLTVRYQGQETRRTRALKAPPGTSLDDRDAAFCASGEFASKGDFPGKAGWGICR